MAELRRHDKGDRVAWLQAELCRAGFDAKPVDGDFGNGTARAVRSCRIVRGLGDGEVADEATQAALGMDGADPALAVTPVIDKITVEVAVRMFHAATPRHNIETHLPIVLSVLRAGALDDRDMVLTALSTIRAESEGFVPIDELGEGYVNYVGKLGNRTLEEAKLYKGRGFIQLTGRDNYIRYGEALNLPLEKEPARANDPAVAAAVLARFLSDRRKRIKYALYGDDLAQARKLVNGGSYGLDRFTAAFRIGEGLVA